MLSASPYLLGRYAPVRQVFDTSLVRRRMSSRDSASSFTSPSPCSLTIFNTCLALRRTFGLWSGVAAAIFWRQTSV